MFAFPPFLARLKDFRHPASKQARAGLAVLRRARSSVQSRTHEDRTPDERHHAAHSPMKTPGTFSITSLIAGTILWSLPALLQAGWAPNANDLDTAIKNGDFGGYMTNTSAWLNEKAPAGANISEAALGLSLIHI